MKLMRSITTVLAILTLLSASPAAAGEELPYLKTRSLEIPVRTVSAGAAPIDGYQLWLTVDGGLTWHAVPGIHTGAGPIGFQAPADGRYGFVVIARDRAGRIQEPPQPGTSPDVECIIDATPPVLEVLQPSAERRIYSGSELVVHWESSDDNPLDMPVTLEFRRTAEDPWLRMGREDSHPASGRLQWWPPYVDGRVEVRISVSDRAGNRTRWVSPHPIEIVAFRAFNDSPILAAKAVSAFRRFPIYYRSPHISPVQIAESEIWVRRGFEAWQRLLDPDRASPYLFEAPEDGVYALYMRAIDRNGEEDRPPPGPDTPPDIEVEVDTHSPEVTLEVGDGGERIFHRGGEELELRWRVRDANLAPGKCRLEVSIDGGEEWRILTEEIETGAEEGTYRWRPPLIESDAMRFRLIVADRAGNRTSALAASVVRLLNPLADAEKVSREHHRRALVLSQGGERASLLLAIESLAGAIQYHPRSADAWHDRGVIRSRLGEHGAALADYRRARKLRPTDLSIAFSLVRGHLNLARSGADPGGEHLKAARDLLATVSKVEIYKDPDFRDLLATYRLLLSAAR
ncbi:MAG: hypothetical protein ACE5GW_03235 [Planctomycetota bacterium]